MRAGADSFPRVFHENQPPLRGVPDGKEEGREGGRGGYFYCGHGPDAAARDSEQIVPGNFVSAISALGGFQRYLGILSWGGFALW